MKKTVLALGSQTKNTLCFCQGGWAYLSRIHQDLNHPEDFAAFVKTAKYFLRRGPRIIAHDLHPEYQSTKYALGLSPAAYKLSVVQHHHAHIASCMLENGLEDQRVIGVAFDGTGLGLQNTIWGGEFLLCNYQDFQRAAHLKEIPLLGGQRAILEPWRLAAAWLYSIFQEEFLSLKLDWARKIDPQKWHLLKRMHQLQLNSPPASSMGRLFDAVGSLLLGRMKINAEAEPAIELEKLASGYSLEDRGYHFRMIRNKEGYILDPSLIFKEIILDLQAQERKERIAYRFHLTVADMLQKACLRLREENRLGTVVLSGGVFQNSLLLKRSLDLLYKESFAVFTPQVLSCNDSGISLGQAALGQSRS